MGYLVRMPQMGMEMDEGEVVAWEYNEGGDVAEGETLVIVESEKASNDVEAREEGILRRILVPEDGTVEPGTPIGIVAGPDEDLDPYETQLDGETGTSEPADGTGGAGGTGSAGGPAAAETVRATPGARELARSDGVDLSAVEGTGPQGVVTEDDVRDHAVETAAESTGDPSASSADTTGPSAGSPPGSDGASAPDEAPASPGARRLASEEGVDLSAVEGTGPQGVVTEADVESAIEAAARPDAGAAASDSATRTVREERTLTGVQKTVSERLGESYRNAVHVTVDRTFDAGALRSVSEAAAAAGLDVSVTDLLVAAVGETLADNPGFNALFEDGTHRLIEAVNVGVAVDVEGGLVTPVIPAVTARSVEEVASVRGELTERALAGEFTTEDLSGGTFTITNLGPFGVDRFDPVINPPEVAILGVGRIREDDSMTLSLSFDHRVRNGADAARFLDDLVRRLTHTAALLEPFETDLLTDDRVAVSVEPASDSQGSRSP